MYCTKRSLKCLKSLLMEIERVLLAVTCRKR
jgi:hypothetical protein